MYLVNLTNENGGIFWIDEFCALKAKWYGSKTKKPGKNLKEMPNEQFKTYDLIILLSVYLINSLMKNIFITTKSLEMRDIRGTYKKHGIKQ